MSVLLILPFPVTSIPEPCLPVQISTEYTLSIGQVYWDSSAGADNYTVAGVTSQGMAVGCDTSDTYCAMLGMACSQVYNVSVTAHNSACSAASVEQGSIQTGELDTHLLLFVSEGGWGGSVKLSFNCQPRLVIFRLCRRLKEMNHLVFPTPCFTYLCCHDVLPSTMCSLRVSRPKVSR